RPALGSFQGEAFAKLDVGSLAPDVQKLALSSVYIGSGLYGLLRGSDGIQPYRLDMDQKWGTKSLRAHWTKKISAWLKEELAGAPLVNLASAEYADALDRTGMHWIDVDFFQESGGKRKAVSVFSKQARGLMARHLCEQYAAGVNAIPTFSAEGYSLDTEVSSPTHFVFVR
ncbi:MAG: peroxide stress protein YaaA, partial [Flavobacteriia bacterium]|nr:peroxide stress protein YaaA [Flavobacteriia bacterium]